MATLSRNLPHVWRISAGARLFVVRVHPSAVSLKTPLVKYRKGRIARFP